MRKNRQKFIVLSHGSSLLPSRYKDAEKEVGHFFYWQGEKAIHLSTNGCFTRPFQKHYAFDKLALGVSNNPVVSWRNVH